jgi:hypothetical protein
VPVPKWFVIARNEYRVRTSAIRSIRPYLPILAILALIVYVGFIAPAIVGLFIDDFVTFILSQIAIASVQIILITMFVYLMLLPIVDALRAEQTKQIEIFLKAPVKSSDALLGEFLGAMPSYAVMVALIAGFFVAALNPLGLDLVQAAMVIAIFVLIFFSALWIGTVIAAVLRTRLANLARGRDIGRALAVVIVIPLIAVMYAFMGGGLQKALADPGTSEMVRAVLGFLPSSWGAEIIISFANSPGNISAVLFETLTRFGGLVVFFVGSLWLGSKAADRAYSLEPMTFAASRVKPDGLFYKTIGHLGGGGSLGSLLVSVFKDYARRLENLSWIAYSIGVTAMIVIFLHEPVMTPGEPLLVLSEMVIPLLTAFTVGMASPGRETLFLYRKSPNGVSRFTYARLLVGCLVTVPIAATMTAIWTILVPQVTLYSLLANVMLASLRTIANVAFVLGLALLVPVFAKESRARAIGAAIYVQVIVFVTIGLEIVLSSWKLFPNLDPYTSLVYSDLLITAIILSAGLALLYLGRSRMNSIE